MSMDSDGTDKRNGRLRSWWKKRGSSSRMGIIVLGIIIWSAAAYSYGYSHGMGSGMEDEKDSFQVSIVNYTIQKGEHGIYEIRGEIQNNYDKPISLSPYMEVKGFDSKGEMVFYAPVFVTGSWEIRPGERASFRGEGFIMDGHTPGDIILGLKTECRGHAWV